MSPDDYRVDDDWIVIASPPTKPGIRAYDDAELFNETEKELRARGIEKVVLVTDSSCAFDSPPVVWFTCLAVKAIGIVEAKTKLAHICERVAKRHQPVTLTKRGKPFVRIEPVENGKASTWKSRARYLGRGGSLPDDLDLPTRALQPSRRLIDD